MTELIRPEDLPRWVPGKILLASDETGWRDVVLRSYDYEPLDVEIPSFRDFVLVAYSAGPTSMDRRVDGRWSREFLVPGNVSLMTRAESSHWHWTNSIQVSHLYLSRDMITRISAETFDRDIADVRLQDVLKTDDKVLRRGIAAIADEIRTNNVGGQILVDAVATQICVQILRRYATVSFREERTNSGLSPLQAKLVSDHVEQRLDQPLRLAELAQVAGLSSSHFLRQFKLRFGCAPHLYVTRRRLLRAQRLLAKTNLSIKAISADSGFSDQSHMTRAFQQYLRTTPNSYRESVRA
jgi:AraC family transcriptional regulator